MTVGTNDAYHWSATYRDGATLSEFDQPRAPGRGFIEVDRAQVSELRLEGTGNPFLVHALAVPEGATPVFFRRKSMTVHADGSQVNREHAHCIGWRRGEQAVYLFVFPDSSTLLTENLQAV